LEREHKEFHTFVFVSRLQGAYHDLAEYGDVRTDESKVDTLVTKVSGDSSLSSACTFIRNDAQLSADFTAAIQYLSNEVLAKNRVVNTLRGTFQVHPGEISRVIEIKMRRTLIIRTQVPPIVSQRKVTLSLMMELTPTIFGGMS